jgi:hypothetical protein
VASVNALAIQRKAVVTGARAGRASKAARPDDWQEPRLAERPDRVRVAVAWLLVANVGRGASAQADLVGGVFGLRHGELATGFGRELFD